MKVVAWEDIEELVFNVENTSGDRRMVKIGTYELLGELKKSIKTVRSPDEVERARHKISSEHPVWGSVQIVRLVDWFLCKKETMYEDPPKPEKGKEGKTDGV